MHADTNEYHNKNFFQKKNSFTNSKFVIKEYLPRKGNKHVQRLFKPIYYT